MKKDSHAYFNVKANKNPGQICLDETADAPHIINFNLNQL